MTIIFGLGNPEEKYNLTYHNMGFWVIDILSKQYGIPLSQKGQDSLYGKGLINGKSVILVKPLTYMNLSGEAVKKFRSKYKDASILVTCDDIDIPRGVVRFRERGSAGTHNGLRSIVENIGEEFARVKIGIGRDEGDLANFVLSKIKDVSLMEKTALLASEEIVKRLK